MRNVHFAAILRGLPLPPLGGRLAIADASRDTRGQPVLDPVGMLAIEDQLEDEADIANGIDIDPDLLLGALPEHALPTFEIPPLRVSPRCVVYYDNYTHSSGMRRAFIACNNPKHGRCEKYKFLCKFPSTAECSAWLIAWFKLSFTTDHHHDHLGMVPTDSSIAVELAALG